MSIPAFIGWLRTADFFNPFKRLEQFFGELLMRGQFCQTTVIGRLEIAPKPGQPIAWPAQLGNVRLPA